MSREQMLGLFILVGLAAALLGSGYAAYERAPQQSELTGFNLFSSWGPDRSDLTLDKNAFVLENTLVIQSPRGEVNIEKGALFFPVLHGSRAVGALFIGSYEYSVDSMVGELVQENVGALIVINRREWNLTGELTTPHELEKARAFFDTFQEGTDILSDIDLPGPTVNRELEIQIGPYRMNVSREKDGIPERGYVIETEDGGRFLLSEDATFFSGHGVTLGQEKDWLAVTWNDVTLVYRPGMVLVNSGATHIVLSAEGITLEKRGDTLYLKGKAGEVSVHAKVNNTLFMSGENFELTVIGDSEVEETDEYYIIRADGFCVELERIQ